LYHCVDLHTGEELWARTFLDNQTLAFGQLFYWDSYNYHGVFPYLWVTVGGGGFFFGPAGPATWYAFDPFTGEWRMTIENVPSGTRISGPNGEICMLNVDLQAGTMALWNMTALISNQGSWGSAAHLRTHNGDNARAWSLNVSIPTGLPGSVQQIKFGDRVVGGSVSTTEVQSWAISLEPGNEGTELFRNTWNAPAEWAAGNETLSWAGTSIDEGVFVVWSKETRQYYGFSTETGDYLWTTDSQHYLDFLIATQTAIVYDKLFSAGVAGITYCYDLTTGDLLWSHEASDPFQEILWSNNWWAQILFITDGKLYMGHSEHSPIDPKPRGAPFYCLNATNGDVIWESEGLFRQSNWGGTGVIGDSIIATQDTYDQRVYAIGKGGSEITASIKNNVVPLGSTVLVDGTMMDVSPGTEDTTTKLRFPNGVPAVSEESMSDWMLYVYKQFSRPADTTGVKIKFAAIDPTGNHKDLGEAISNSYGSYGFEFKPEDEGQYMITATFEGSNSYYPSTAVTYLSVVPAAEKLDIPTVDEIAQTTVSQMPAYPTPPTADEIAQETVNQMPAYPEPTTCPEIPAYLTIDIVSILLVVIILIIGLYCCFVKKQK
jgi:outer membrane protein assembly factor BamB